MKVYQQPDRVLHDHIPRRPVGQRFSRKISTSYSYIPKTRTVFLGYKYQWQTCNQESEIFNRLLLLRAYFSEGAF